MTDAGVSKDLPPIRNTVSRRRVLQGMAGVGLGAAGVAILGSEGLSIPEIPNAAQINAAKKIEDPKVNKITFKVKENSPDYNPQLRGPNNRTEPRIPQNNEPPNNDGLLEPGTVVTGIPSEGTGPDVRTRTNGDWIAYKDSKGRVRFVASKYLEAQPAGQ